MSSFKKKENPSKAYTIHLPFEQGFNGKGKRRLDEPAPLPSLRTGDELITGKVDNNARIVLGRDRDPFGAGPRGIKEFESIDEDSISQVSGYSDYMGAGAIDIVVGSGAPYPMDMSKLERPNNLPPIYTTANSLKLKASFLSDQSGHPGVLMDAARIYITQMSDIDDYFGIAKRGFKTDLGPTSAIMMKADRIRLHSRRDIKIIAGKESGVDIDSNGYLIKEKPRIHLMAGNGTLGNQQPIPLGDNLVECIKSIFEALQDNLEIMHSITKSQAELNTVVENSIRVNPAGPTAPDFVSQIAGVFKKLSDMKDIFSIYYSKFLNLPGQELTYLEPSSTKYILSRYNTTN